MVTNTTTGPGRVLVVTDRRLVGDTITLTLNHGVFDARVETSAEHATRRIATWSPQIAIVDMDVINKPLIESLGLNTNQAPSRIPVIGLTRRGDLKSKLSAFEMGLDDIVTVPFSPEELLARTLALYRRVHGASSVPFSQTLKIGEIEIDILNRDVRAGTSVIHLTGLEQSLLYLLAANAGRVIGRDEIIDALWGTDYVSESNIVDRHIRALRSKLQNDWRRPRFIATVPGKGYRFIPTFSSESGSAA